MRPQCVPEDALVRPPYAIASIFPGIDIDRKQLRLLTFGMKG